jgi:hypothetical protein
MRCGSATAVREAVAQGAGIGILYRDAVEPEIKRGEFKAVEIPGLDLRRSSYIVYSKQKGLSVLAQEFLVLLRDDTSKDVPIQTIVPPKVRGRVRPRLRDHVTPLTVFCSLWSPHMTWSC